MGARRWRGATAIVTGAGSGIGAELAAALARRGARVVLADIDEAGAHRRAERIRSHGGDATAAGLDVTDAEAVASVVADAVSRTGRLDYLFNNAGIAVAGEVSDIGASDWRRVLDVNLLGVIHGVQAAYPRMVAQKSGHIVNTSSVAGLVPYPMVLPYTTSKHAVVGLSLALAAEAAGHGVRVSVVCPGTIRTPIWERSPIRGGWDRADALARMRTAMSADVCAERIVSGVERGRKVIAITAETRLMWALARLSPELSVWVHSRLAKRVRALASSASA